MSILSAMGFKKKPEKQYYVHALLNYHDWSYCRKGPYRYRWVAEWVASSLMTRNPYGMAAIKDTPDKPTITY